MFVVVNFRMEGFHCWPNAPEHRRYLRSKHRHVFHVRVEVEVGGNDREIECHDLLDACLDAFGGGDMGADSCEMMAESLADELISFYGDRSITVEVLEDGEVGAKHVHHKQTV